MSEKEKKMTENNTSKQQEKQAKEQQALKAKKAKEQQAAEAKKAKEQQAAAAKQAKEDAKLQEAAKKEAAKKEKAEKAAAKEQAPKQIKQDSAEQKATEPAQKAEKSKAEKKKTTPEEKEEMKRLEQERKAAKKQNKKEPKGIVNVDAEGNVIGSSFPVSKKAKKDHRKTSVGYTALAFILQVLAIVPLIGVTVFLAIKGYRLLPSYGLWHFIGLIILAAFGLIYLVVALIVTRKKSKSSILSQTAKVAFTYVCLTTVFGMIVTYIVPDVIANATSSTLYAEDLYYKASEQLEENAALERQFIMYNVLNGNLNRYDAETESVAENGDFSYMTLEKHTTNTSGQVMSYENAYIAQQYAVYGAYSIEQFDQALALIETNDPNKAELYNFIYKTYTLNDFDYALDYTSINRRAITMAMVDYIYEYADYEKLVADGFKNAKLKQLFANNYDNFNQDGYQTFDDALLLYAQMDQRMTIPVVLRLILNKGWSYTQPSIDQANSKLYYTDQNSFLYEMYDPETVRKFVEEEHGTFDYEDNLLNADGKETTVHFGFNADGWQVYQNGVVKRPVKWLVLDMLGDPMALTSIDLSETQVLGFGIGDLIDLIDGMAGGLVGSIGDLLQVDVAKLIKSATDGAGLKLGIYFDDAGALQIQIMPMNTDYGMLGYMQATWVQSNNLLMAVINVLNIRNWLYIFGGVGLILVIAAGVLRECGKRTRERAAIVRDRLIRAGVQPAGDMEATNKQLEALGKAENDARRIEKVQLKQLQAEKEYDEARLELIDIQLGKEEKLAKAEAKARQEESKKQLELEKAKQSASDDKAKQKDKKANDKKSDKKDKADDKDKKPEKEKKADKDKKADKRSENDKKEGKEEKAEKAETEQAPAQEGEQQAESSEKEAKPAKAAKPAANAKPAQKKPATGARPAAKPAAKPSGARPAGTRPTGTRPAGSKPSTGNRPRPKS